MSNKLRMKKRTPKQKPVKQNTKTPAVKKPVSIVQKNPKLTILVMVVTYFMLDYLMMDADFELHMGFIIGFTLLAISTLYSYYGFDYHREIYPVGGTDVPGFIKNKKRFVLIGWIVIAVWGILLLVFEPILVPKFFPVLDSTYSESQIMLMVFIAPVMEEITFRYLLYDRWLKRKWGWFLGFLASSLIFVLCHPVTDLHSAVVYYVPTILFFLIYRECGLYGSILMHMIYNMIAI